MKTQKWSILAGIFVLAVIGGIFISFGPPQLMARTETPEFCASCHVMQSQYDAWFQVGAHRTIRCVDCHLPHENSAAYYIWKSIDGIKDMVVFHSGRTPEFIRISSRQEGVVQSNCIRCHDARVSQIDNDRHCWSCHRGLQHGQAGVRLTSW